MLNSIAAYWYMLYPSRPNVQFPYSIYFTLFSFFRQMAKEEKWKVYQKIRHF